MREFDLLKKTCPKCGHEKVACIEFTPKATYCRSCAHEKWLETKRKQPKVASRGWRTIGFTL